MDQLQKYAEIIGIPLAVASDPVEFGTAVKEFAREGIETIFVDSAGRSQRDEMKMAELKEFLGSMDGAEIHLVLSATTQPRTIKSVVGRFGALWSLVYFASCLIFRRLTARLVPRNSMTFMTASSAVIILLVAKERFG